MNAYRKIANANHEEAGAYTTRSFSRHGLGKGARKLKKIVNRNAKRAEAREAFRVEAN